MKRIIALVLALTMCAFALASCDQGVGAETTNPNEITNTLPAEKEPPVPVKVNDLNGKTPKELWEAACASYSEFNSFAVYYEMSEEETKDGVTHKWVEVVEVKISGNDLYFKAFDANYKNDVLEETDIVDEATIVDGVGYGNGYKYSGDGFVVVENEYNKYEILDAYVREIFEGAIPVTALNDVELYQLGDEYYFSGTTFGDSDDEIKFSVHFDKNGILTKLGIEDDSPRWKAIFELTNINKPVTITAPEDAASYTDFIPVDPDGLAKLQDVIETLTGATSYRASFSAGVSSGGVVELQRGVNYSVDGEQEARIDDNSTTYFNKGTAYYTQSIDGDLTMDPSQNVKDMFTTCSAWKNDACVLLQQKIQVLTMSSYTSGEQDQITNYNIRIILKNGDSVSVSFDEAMTEINIYEYSKLDDSSRKYSFNEINTGTVQINIPTLA